MYRHSYGFSISVPSGHFIIAIRATHCLHLRKAPRFRSVLAAALRARTPVCPIIRPDLVPLVFKLILPLFKPVDVFVNLAGLALNLFNAPHLALRGFGKCCGIVNGVPRHLFRQDPLNCLPSRQILSPAMVVTSAFTTAASPFIFPHTMSPSL